MVWARARAVALSVSSGGGATRPQLPFRVLARSSSGGLQIDGGPGGFQARSLSVTDLAWVLVAREYATQHGALLDEVLVNRLRYLEGTPRGSTRWIDTGHALRLLAAAGGL